MLVLMAATCATLSLVDSDFDAQSLRVSHLDCSVHLMYDLLQTWSWTRDFLPFHISSPLLVNFVLVMPIAFLRIAVFSLRC